MPHRVFFRVATKMGTGIVEHLPVRVSEWVMVIPAIGMNIVLRAQPDMFSKSPSFSTLSSWATQETWALLCLMCGGIRVIALAINGSFGTSFPYSPHLRMFASLIGILFWSQYSLAFVDAAVTGQGAWSGVVPYTTFVVFELVNFWRSNVDRLSAAKR